MKDKIKKLEKRLELMELLLNQKDVIEELPLCIGCNDRIVSHAAELQFVLRELKAEEGKSEKEQ